MDRDVSLDSFLGYVLEIVDLNLEQNKSIVEQIKLMDEEKIEIISEHSDETPYSDSSDIISLTFDGYLVLEIEVQYNGIVEILEYSEEYLLIP